MPTSTVPIGVRLCSRSLCLTPCPPNMAWSLVAVRLPSMVSPSLLCHPHDLAPSRCLRSHYMLLLQKSTSSVCGRVVLSSFPPPRHILHIFSFPPSLSIGSSAYLRFYPPDPLLSQSTPFPPSFPILYPLPSSLPRSYVLSCLLRRSGAVHPC